MTRSGRKTLASIEKALQEVKGEEAGLQEK